VFWNLPGKIRYWVFVLSNSENIARTAFLEPKTTENHSFKTRTGNRTGEAIGSGFYRSDHWFTGSWSGFLDID
jgi:hypothetical protein